MTRSEPEPFTVAPLQGFLDWRIETDPALWRTDVAILGSPHSEPYATDGFPNDQAEAPAAIRDVSLQFCDGPAHWDFDLGAPLAERAPAGLDCGDIPFAEGTYDDHMARVTRLISGLIRGGTQVFVLGGDHGITIPVVDALEAVGEPVHMVQIDAHLDWREDIDGIHRGYSSPMRWASRRPWIAGMTQIGLRGTGSARRQEVEAALAYGSHLFTASDVQESGFAAALATIPSDVPLYITVDADGVDPSEMPGVVGPAPGGPMMRQLLPFLRTLARRQRVVGLDVVEVAPRYDSPSRITCIAAGRIIVNVLGASQRR